MYYGFYLFAIALVVMIGQLAFALYQVASLLYLSWAGTAGKPYAAACGSTDLKWGKSSSRGEGSPACREDGCRRRHPPSDGNKLFCNKFRRRDNFHELAPSSKRRITLSLIRLRAGLKTLW